MLRKSISIVISVTLGKTLIFPKKNAGGSRNVSCQIFTPAGLALTSDAGHKNP